MLSFFTDILRRELSQHPAMTIIVIAIASYSVFSYTGHARAADLLALDKRVSNLDATLSREVVLLKTYVERGRIEQNLEANRRELWRIQRTIEESGPGIDPVYIERADGLRIAIERNERALKDLERKIEESYHPVYRN